MNENVDAELYGTGKVEEPIIPWPDPTDEMLDNDHLFDAIWETIKKWDINVPNAYVGYCGATGNHVRAIYEAVKDLKQVID